MSRDDLPMAGLERLAEAIVFAHEAPHELDLAQRALAGDGAASAAALLDAASLATAALAADGVAMPRELQRRLAFAGAAFCAARQAQRAPQPRPVPAMMTVARTRTTPASLLLAIGAAAGMALALWLHGDKSTVVPTRDELLAAGAMTIPWQPGPSRAHGTVQGDIVWHAGHQQGYLRIRGLAPLAEDQQYQLWIVDQRRTGAPVDGGLFDLRDDREQLVPIQARLPVADAAAFVVTVEPRGGVVVSEQHDVVAIASR